MKDDPQLCVRNLKIQLISSQTVIEPVAGINFELHKGEILAVVGESGCGKSMTTLALSRLLPENAMYCIGSEILLNQIPLQSLSENEMRKIRGAKIAMIFQEPTLALNPVLTIGDQLIEALKQLPVALSNEALKQRAISLLTDVKIPQPSVCLKQYPHQLSGGMKQRVMIAIALAQSPEILIADEPTTALDVTTQRQILDLLKELIQRYQMSVLLITHDLGIVSEMADSVAVMYAGDIIEYSPKADFFTHPRHPYSQKLFGALPENAFSGQKLAVIPGEVPSLDRTFKLCRFRGRCQYVFKPCEEKMPVMVGLNQQQVKCHWYDDNIMKNLPQELTMANLTAANGATKINLIQESFVIPQDEKPLLEVKSLKCYYPIQKGFFKRTVGYVKAVDDVSFNLYEGQTLAIVGESGCGKTTLGKSLLRLLPIYSGGILFDEIDLLKLSKRKLRAKRQDIQMIFQDPFSSMDPHMDVAEILEEGMLALKIGSDAAERQDRIDQLLNQVGLSIAIKDRYPHELSGGQRQRVAIARALAVGAKLIVCDEPTSALDVSVQAQILNLLKALQEDLGISYIFITHNIGVVQYLAHTVAVMYHGKIVEYGPAQKVLNKPEHPYTKLLLAAIPTIASRFE